MEIIFLLIPLSLVLLGAATWGFFWAVKNGQFDDLDSPALAMLDDDEPQRAVNSKCNRSNKEGQ